MYQSPTIRFSDLTSVNDTYYQSILVFLYYSFHRFRKVCDQVFDVFDSYADAYAVFVYACFGHCFRGAVDVDGGGGVDDQGADVADVGGNLYVFQFVDELIGAFFGAGADGEDSAAFAV